MSTSLKILLAVLVVGAGCEDFDYLFEGTNDDAVSEQWSFSDISVSVKHEGNTYHGKEPGNWKLALAQRTGSVPECGTVPDAVKQNYEFHELLPYYRGYYIINKNQRMNWFEAKEFCERDGSHLAIINSEEEAYLLRHLYYDNPTSRDDSIQESFVGVSDIDEEGNFVTIFGEPLSSTGYSDWGSGEPSNGGSSGEDCVTYHRKHYLNDIGCDRELFFYCEYELPQN